MQKGLYPGTTYEKSRGRWKAQGRINGLTKSLGYFATQAEAYAAVLRAKEAARATQQALLDPDITSTGAELSEGLKEATVAQSNVLIERPWAMTLLEARIFVLLLRGLRREETASRRITVLLADLMGHDPIGGRGYQLLHAALDSLDAVRIELPMPNRQKDWHKVPLLHSLQLDSGQGTVSGYFSADVLPYLTNLVDNFTLGQVADLLSIKNPTTYRWYWLLKSWEYRSPITVQVDRLRELTTGVNSYPQFTEYRRSVLKPAVDELNKLNFTVAYREHKVGRSVESVEFYISTKPKPKPRQLILALEPPPAVEAARREPLTLLEAKVSTRLGKLQLTEAQTRRVLDVLAGNEQQLELLLRRTYPLLRDFETRSKPFENVGATTVALLKTTFPNLYKDTLKV
jgi:hypothetical protein